ncbi:hypothetical protein BO94DRAFT_615736 [Aspergillus sclerotioniger CBS 115572]|uniref:Arrestin-like N-terminal domain-containing protein n=1 Tax=Aspergillus sclerotioniger CBS 115572 TaxID=1450535 RepID=A0A317X5Y2_9EURO|nr:hypothetical protein BO94DRAFT_615736 [Aspergillus sclerotioniger CBS 115572]PWY93032.1 hypothetical protein BO94DRAFT_615736 [Aspergillus sclerotioniger CBS 115572]
MKQLSLPTLGRRFFKKSSNINISIRLDDTVLKPYYAPGDRIQGVVTVTVDKAVQFSHVNLIFEGSTQVTLLQPKTVLRHCEASHKFLQLYHPIKEDCITPGLFQPGVVYTFPYIFIVPDRLLSGSCTHPTNEHHIHQTHTQLPPTLRVTNVSQAVCQVLYAIKFTVARQSSKDGPLHKRETLGSETRHVTVIPTAAREATSSIEDIFNYANSSHPSQLFVRQRNVEWPLKQQGFPKGSPSSTSRSATATEIQLSASENHHATPYLTTITVYLRFDPGTKTQEPPRIRKISPTLRTTTNYSTMPHRANPPLTKTDQQQLSYGGSHVETTPLTSLRGTTHIQWTRYRTIATAGDRPKYLISGNQNEEENTPIVADEPQCDHYYTAAIEVPISLPKKQDGKGGLLLPTFHSCYVSRVYVLELCVSYCSSSRTRIPQSTVVEVPVQVARRTSNAGGSMEMLCEKQGKTMSSLSVNNCYARCGLVSTIKGTEQMDLPLLPGGREPPELPRYGDAVFGG